MKKHYLLCLFLPLLLVLLTFVVWSLAFKHKATSSGGGIDFLLRDDPTLKKLDGSNWMTDYMELLGPRTLKEVCIPGSHDAGMSVYQSGTTLASPCNTLTQSLPVSGQLNSGVRYFDVRPVIGGGAQFLTGHYSFVAKESWQGANGQSIESIVNDINQFTRFHKEVVIVRLAHTLNTEVGNSKYRKFNQDEWDRLFGLLDQTKDLYITNNRTVHLPSITLTNLTQNFTKAAVMYIVAEENTEANLSNRLGKGYFNLTNLNLYHKYSKTDNLGKMIEDQLSKLKQFSQNNYFILSWTLTQGAKEVSLCKVNLAKSIRKLAEKANDKLAPSIYYEVASNQYPSVLYADNIHDRDIAITAMAINKKLKFT